jgi:secreted trypsin-like serine protease
MTRVLAAVLFLVSMVPAGAMVGGADARAPATRHVVMIVGSRGNVCSGTALARDLVLTAAHCVSATADYRAVGYGGSYIIAARSVAVHPGFDPRAYARNRATADVALVHLQKPLPASIVPADLGSGSASGVGQAVTVAGVGVTQSGGDAGIGIARSARLVTTGTPGTLQIRLVDPATRNAKPGLGACTGDSGGPAFEDVAGRLAVIGVVAWSTGPNGAAGCGGMTGIAPLVRYRAWIVETARKFGTALRP